MYKKDVYTCLFSFWRSSGLQRLNPVESGCGRRRQKDWSFICQLSSKHGLLRRSAERQGFFRPLCCFWFWARKRKHIFARVIFSRGRLSLSMGQLCACAAASCPTGFKTVGSKASCALRPCMLEKKKPFGGFYALQHGSDSRTRTIQRGTFQFRGHAPRKWARMARRCCHDVPPKNVSSR